MQSQVIDMFCEKQPTPHIPLNEETYPRLQTIFEKKKKLKTLENSFPCLFALKILFTATARKLKKLV